MGAYREEIAGLAKGLAMAVLVEDVLLLKNLAIYMVFYFNEKTGEGAPISRVACVSYKADILFYPAYIKY